MGVFWYFAPVAVILGTGVSIPAGIPSWSRLLIFYVRCCRISIKTMQNSQRLNSILKIVPQVKDGEKLPVGFRRRDTERILAGHEITAA